MDFVDPIVEVGVVDDVFVTDLARVEVIGGDTIRYTLTALQQSDRGGSHVNVVRSKLIWSFHRRIEVDNVFKRAAEQIYTEMMNGRPRTSGAN